MLKSEIKAKVMYKWDRKTNIGCKFLPGDKVKVIRTPDFISKVSAKKKGKKGKIIAVTTVDGVHMRTVYKKTPCKAKKCPANAWLKSPHSHTASLTQRRDFTKYYVQFEDFQIFAYDSGYLKLVK